MATITVKNLPDELHERLRRRAARHRRSLNNEIIECLQGAIEAHRIDPDELLVRARRIRSNVTGRLTQTRLEGLRRHRQ